MPKLNFGPSASPQGTPNPLPQNSGLNSPKPSVVPPTQSMAPRGSLFGGIEGVNPTFDTNYLRAGYYAMLIRQVKQAINRKKVPFIAIEMTVVAVLEANPEGTSHRVGEEVAHLLMSDKDAFLPNFKQFISATNGVQPDEVRQEHCEAIVDASNPMGGRVVYVRATNIITRDGKPFTRVTYGNECSLQEILGFVEPMPQQTMERIFGKGTIEAAMAANAGPDTAG